MNIKDFFGPRLRNKRKTGEAGDIVIKNGAGAGWLGPTERLAGWGWLAGDGWMGLIGWGLLGWGCLSGAGG